VLFFININGKIVLREKLKEMLVSVEHAGKMVIGDILALLGILESLLESLTSFGGLACKGLQSSGDILGVVQRKVKNR
jgi:hypothetical protein